MKARRTAFLLLIGLAALGAFAAGRSSADDLTWHTGTAMLGGDERSPQFSTVSSSERWTYGASGGVAHWIDASGATHSGGWPDCLLPPTEERPDRDQLVPVRFGTVPVDRGSFGSGPVVVSVDCR